MPTSLENQFISDTYKGVLHTNNIPLSSSNQQGIVYDGVGNQSSLIIFKNGFGASIFGNSSINGHLSVNSTSMSGNLTAGSANINGNTVITGTFSSKSAYTDGNNTITGNLNVGGSTVVSSGLSATGNVNVFGSSVVTGNSTILGYLNAGSSSIVNSISAGGDMVVSGNIRGNNIALSGNSVVGGNSSVTGNLGVGGNLNVASNSTVYGFSDVYGPTYIEDTLTVTEDVVVNKSVTSDFTDTNRLNVRTNTTIGGSLTVGSVTYPIHNSPINLLDLIYPVDCIILNLDNRNPADYLEWGTWRRVSHGFYLAGVGTGQDINGAQRTVSPDVSDPQGEYSHRLTVAELPSHKHDLYKVLEWPQRLGVVTEQNQSGTRVDYNSYSPNTEYTGNDLYHNNMVPTFGVYVWRRIS